MATTFDLYAASFLRLNKLNIINAILLLVRINGSFPIAEADPTMFKREESNPGIQKPGRGGPNICHHSCALLVNKKGGFDPLSLDPPLDSHSESHQLTGFAII